MSERFGGAFADPTRVARVKWLYMKSFLESRLFESFRRKQIVNGCVKISVFVSATNDVLLSKGDCVKEESVNSNIMQSALPFYATLKHQKTRALRFSIQIRWASVG